MVRRPLGFNGERDLVAHSVQKMAANEVQSVEAEIGIRINELYKRTFVCDFEAIGVKQRINFRFVPEATQGICLSGRLIHQSVDAVNGISATERYTLYTSIL